MYPAVARRSSSLSSSINAEVVDDDFVFLDANEIQEQPPSYQEAISEPPPPYTAGQNAQFIPYTHAELPTYRDATIDSQLEAVPSEPVPSTSSASATATTSSRKTDALNSVPFELSPELLLAINASSLTLPTIPRLNMGQYWYDFSFERTFLRDSEAAYVDCPEEFGWQEGGSGLRVQLPDQLQDEWHNTDDIVSEDLIAFD